MRQVHIHKGIVKIEVCKYFDDLDIRSDYYYYLGQILTACWLSENGTKFSRPQISHCVRWLATLIAAAGLHHDKQTSRKKYGYVRTCHRSYTPAVTTG